MNEHILLAYGFDGNGAGECLVDDSISQQVRGDKLTWVHMDGSNPKTRDWLKQEVSYLDPHIVDALLAEETRPRMTQLDDGVLLILRGVNLNDNAAPEDMVSIRLWVDKHRIISVRIRKLKAVTDIADKIKAGKAPKDAGGFLCMLVSKLFARMEPVLTQLDDSVDDAEEKILESADSSLRESIIGVRKQAIMFRRYMAPQKDAVGQLRMADLTWIDENHKRSLYESHNRITHYVEDLDAVRERAQIVKDELANMLADKLNKNMYVLSVIAAVFLPLGFLTGLLGVNVAGIPGVENPKAFYIFCGTLVSVVAMQVVIFKKLKWF